MGRASLDWKFRLDSAINEVPVGDLIDGSSQPIQLLLGKSDVGDTPIIDMVAVCSLVRSINPVHAFEFGTFTGNAALHIAMNAPALLQLVTIDLAPATRDKIPGLDWESTIDDRIIGTKFKGTDHAAKIKQVFADSRSFDVTPYFGQMDFVWVDACHEYDFVVSDSAKALQMVTPDGVVAWHDYSRAFPGVVRYINELATKRDIFWIAGTQVVFCRGRRGSNK